MEKEIDRFNAQADDGTVYTIVEIKEYTTFRPLSGPEQQIPAMKRLELLGGSHVNCKSDGIYEIFETGEIVRKIG